jgi:hypothetical protein
MYSVLNDVLISDDNWLFAYQGTNYIHNILQGKSALTNKQLRTWKTLLEERKECCSSLGADYHFIILPLKQCVYADKLASYTISELRPARQLQKNTGAVYPLAFFQELKKESHCYYQYDTHWNDFGCDKFYASLLKQELPAEIEPFYAVPLHDLWVKIHSEPCPEGLCYRYPQNNIIYYNQIENVGGLIICENKIHSKNIAVIFGDSFSRFCINTISQYFSHVFFFQTTGFDKDILLKIQPDTVINCHAENFIHSAEEIRFQSFFEALLYKFLISGKNTLLQQKELKQYAFLLPDEHVQILQEIIFLFQKPHFTVEHILAYLCSQHGFDEQKLIKLLSHKKIS